MSEKDMLGVRIPAELKSLVDADSRSNQEVVESALWREFGGKRKAALEQRIEEKIDRINTVEKEIHNRENELSEHWRELEAFRSKLEEKEGKEQRRKEAVNDFINEMLDLGATPPADHHRVQALADKWFDGNGEEAADAIVRRAMERDDVNREILK